MSRLPIVFIHGIRLNAACWVEVLPQVPREYMAAAVDLPGHGSRRGERFSFEAARAVVRDAIDRAGGRAILVGHSLGGYAAMAFSSREPDRVAGLVVAGATCAPTSGATQPFLAAHRLLSTFADGGERVSARILRAVLPRRTADAVARAGIASEVIPDAVAALRSSRPLDDLAAYPGPVRFVNGRHDHLRVEERRFSAAAEDAALVVLRGGHYLPMTRPNAFAREVLDFASAIS
ncbi:alpha/beta fold hydrolase [Agromyces sp. CFH 90414]|uniref:Alpha/beta fold hydrolase n=1 Tax=Agromyces agglutinans TaxID=2662258 RepID=A0A6I2FF10_9MICO|nr:alpha/beta fold hydrolase [Agromyces agglutinans]MRG61290.1 alpha/beta fold hydrolase [Agromyces agglutinans]